MKNSGQLLGLRRGLKVLEILAAAGDGLTFNDLKAAFDDMVPSTISRLLKALIDEEMIRLDHNSKLYSLAERSNKLAEMITGKMSFAERIQPHLDALAKETGLSAAFFQYEEGRAVLTAKSEQPEAFHYAAVGSSPASPKHAMKMLCFSHEDSSPKDGFDIEKLKDLKNKSVFINRDDDQVGLTRIAAPVFIGAGSKFAGAIGISFYQQFDNEKLEQLAGAVKKNAEKMNLNL